MARSYKKNPFMGHSLAESEKQDKVRAHRKLRAHFRTALNSTDDLETFHFDNTAEAHSNINDFAKDGRQYVPLHVRQDGRSVEAVSKPKWIHSDREVHKTIGK